MELSINNLSKTYANGVVALDDVSLTIPTGLFGLLGPNGAGKSTLMRTIATLQEADSGEITFEGIDVLRQKNEVKKMLGYLPQSFGFYPKDTGYNLLDHFTLLKGVKDKKEREAKVEELLKRVNLWNERKQKLGTYSNGMRQRFGIAQALIGNPKLIIVDEPTAGLDPEERVRFHNLLSEIGENVVVILSTHIVDDVSDLCTNMAIIDKGRIILKENIFEAVFHLKGNIWEKEIAKVNLAEYEEKYDVISTRLFAGKTFIHIHSEANPENGFMSIEPSLEDVYFYHLNQAN
ncbi:MAG: multidrug ABC transporter ATP-binding protein [candidate division Zixibacteria bacterium SM23_73_3]|nr:MAG: multidrug ABC transporter ATP-binding protein [candidate division Zixibacteria bacterium SM23_73_3]